MFEVLESGRVTLADTVTAVYNAIRVLQYRDRVNDWAYADFLKLTEATTTDEQIKLALDLIHEIEKHEQAPVATLDNKVAREYELTLATLGDKRVRQELVYDPKRAKELLRQLEEEVAIP